MSLDDRFKYEIPGTVSLFLLENELWVTEMIRKNPECPYWHQINLARRQMQGLYEGYQAAAPSEQKLTQVQFNLINLIQVFGDLEKYKEPQKTLLDDHCSVLIKLTGDELYIAHESWSTFESMTRIWKRYEFNFHKTEGGEVVPGKTISMSSYPATIHSIDDFYLTSEKIAVTETTNVVYNNTLYDEFLTPEHVLEPFRIMTANRLATSAPQWVAIMKSYNGGTYCN